MSVTSGFFNSLSGDRKYDAIQISSMFDGLITDGIYNGYLESFMVTASSPASMVVTVGEGRCWFNHTWTLNDAPLPLTLDVGDVVLNRIDTIVIDVDSTDTVRACTIKVVKGTPSSQAVRPTLENTETHHQYPLCDISVPAGATTITQSNITNRRGTSDCPFVATLMTTVTVDELLVQWESQWNDWMTDRVDAMDTWTAEQQEAFTTWFQTVQDILDENTAGNLLNRINHRTGINAIATYSAGVVAITAPDDAGEILTFVAPSDFLSSDTYTLNGEALTITDLNGEALDDSWKKNSPVTITVSGGKAFFKAGGSGKNDTLPPLLGNMTVEVVEGEETDTYTIKMDKLILDKTTEMVGGAQLEWGEEMPTKPGKGTGGIKTWTREEVITTDKPYDGLYLGDVTPSDAVNETILWLPENDSGSVKLVPFIVLSTDYLGGVYVVRKGVKAAWLSTFGATSEFLGSNIDQWFKSTYANSILDKSVSDRVLQCDVPVKLDGTTVPLKFWVPSSRELDPDSSEVGGQHMPYFKDSARRVAPLDDSTTGGVYWMRTPMDATHVFIVGSDGGMGNRASTTGSIAIRPAFVLPKDFQIQQRPDGSYTVWTGENGLTWEDLTVSDDVTETIVNILEPKTGMVPTILLSSNFNDSDGLLFLRQEVLDATATGNRWISGTTDQYSKCQSYNRIQNWAENDVDPKIVAKKVLATIKQRSVYYSSSNVYAITSCEAYAFELGNDELGFSAFSEGSCGTKLPYFSSNTRRIAYLNGASKSYNTRDTSVRPMASSDSWYIVSTGGVRSTSTSAVNVRPAILISKDIWFNKLPDGTYDLVPEDPALAAQGISTMAEAGTPVQLKDIPVSDASIKRTLILPEGENSQPFIYLSSNYNESGRGMMLREFTLPESTEFSAYGVWNYASSLLFQKIANWFDTLPSDLKRWIDPITIHYRYATGYTSSSTFLSGTVEATAFPLTYNNVSGSKGDSSYYGENIPYFTSNERRKAFIEGTETPAGYWLSDAHSKYDAFSSGVRFYTVASSGVISYADFRDSPQYIRPAITLPPETWFIDNGDDTYTFVGDEPASSEFVSHTVEVPHGQKVVFRQFTQNQKKQFQTMLVGGVYPPLGDVEPPFKLPEFTGNHAIFGDEIAGRIEIYESGELRLNPGTYDFFLVGGGGPGFRGGYSEYSYSTGGGGGGGYTYTEKNVVFESLTIGNVLIGGQSSHTAITIGDKNMQANGGASGNQSYGGAGGSGGGGGGYERDYTHYVGPGGSDGAKGGDGYNKTHAGGAGQGSTTRSFGEPTGVLYGGGGGGGAVSGKGSGGAGGEGGGGAGGNGSSTTKPGVAGTPNTGGGGGGGADYTGTSTQAGAGGSGIIIVRWNNAAQ